jgi:hypothetical protein
MTRSQRRAQGARETAPGADRKRPRRRPLARSAAPVVRSRGAGRGRHLDFVSPLELEDALELASTEPRALDDTRLWRDWLAFLEGAAHNGGLRIKA